MGIAGKSLTHDLQRARKAALVAAREEAAQTAARAREDIADLERADEAQSRLEAIDADLAEQIAKKTAELTAKAEGRRVKERRVAGAAYAAVRARGMALRDIARKSGVAESVIRECIDAAEAAAAEPAAKLAGKTQAAGAERSAPAAAEAPGDAGGPPLLSAASSG
jgi:GNAT superfamily N-acetyltransferase